MISTTMKAGERLYHRQAGGGGWGDPLQREPKLVARDVKNEKVSVEAARDDYGVVLNQASGAIDREATETLRRQRLQAGSAGPIRERNFGSG